LAEIVTMLASWVATMTAVFALLAWDERRLDPMRLARAWPISTRRAAVVIAGPFCLPLHFWRTRRTVGGALVGLAAMAAVVLLDAAVTTCVGWALGVEP
jgi:hypothetical protein